MFRQRPAHQRTTLRPTPPCRVCLLRTERLPTAALLRCLPHTTCFKTVQQPPCSLRRTTAQARLGSRKHPPRSTRTERRPTHTAHHPRRTLRLRLPMERRRLLTRTGHRVRRSTALCLPIRTSHRCLRRTTCILVSVLQRPCSRRRTTLRPTRMGGHKMFRQRPAHQRTTLRPTPPCRVCLLRTERLPTAALLRCLPHTTCFKTVQQPPCSLRRTTAQARGRRKHPLQPTRTECKVSRHRHTTLRARPCMVHPLDRPRQRTTARPRTVRRRPTCARHTPRPALRLPTVRQRTGMVCSHALRRLQTE
eukprot:Rhum_TRINITY_DN14139_c0_g1::Rhum_TRINITY_DN14139_c0_g1_i1::g.70122::m.70122